MLSVDEPLAHQTVQAIRIGDVQGLRRLLGAHPDLATTRIDGARTLLHVATDWPGHFPSVAATIAGLVEAGADVNARFVGRHAETALHWAASSDDVTAIDALVDAGADLEALGGVMDDGTPLADAVIFGQWHAAHRLVARGAQTTLWQAAALGLIERVEAIFAVEPPPTADEITRALWSACTGGQQPAAQFLLARGADLNWSRRLGDEDLTPLDAADRAGDQDLAEWLRTQGAKSARELS
jgi:ankyrin repeat protein